MKLLLSLASLVAASLAQSAAPFPMETHSHGYIIETIDNDPQSLMETIFGSEQQPASSLRRAPRKRRVKDQMRRIKMETTSGDEFAGLLDIDNETDLNLIRSNPKVLRVYKNEEVRMTEVTSNWNLDRIDQAFGMDGQYIEQIEQGRNVDIYIVDTGIFQNHSEFRDDSSAASRVLPGVNAVGDQIPAEMDCNSHGTHVASIAAGNTFGVARQAKIIPVKVLDCNGSGTVWSVLRGIGWILDRIKAEKPQGRLRVINFSLEDRGGQGGNSILDQAVKALVSAGAVVTVAAGNGNTDACSVSPARESSVLTIGSLSSDDSTAQSSNFGPCVDLFAPGEFIVGAFPLQGKSITKSGTSMAAPLVAGVAATLRERFPTYTVQQIINEIKKNAAQISCTVDQDCKGMVPAKTLILQSLAAKGRNTFGVPSVSLDNRRMDFTLWSPNLVLQPLSVRRPSQCFQFTSRVLMQSSLIPARLSILLSTVDLPLGLSSSLQLLANPACSSSLSSPTAANFSWVMIDSTPRKTTVLRYGDSSSPASDAVALESSNVLPLSLTKDTFFVLKAQLADKQQLRITLSTVASFEPGAAETDLVDSNIPLPLTDISKPFKVSFKTSGGPIKLSNIITCNVALSSKPPTARSRTKAKAGSRKA